MKLCVVQPHLRNLFFKRKNTDKNRCNCIYFWFIREVCMDSNPFLGDITLDTICPLWYNFATFALTVEAAAIADLYTVVCP